MPRTMRAKASPVRYTGKLYSFSLPKQELNRHKTAYLISLAAAAGLYIALGLSRSAALGGPANPAAFYVVLPYVGLLLPLGLGIGRALLLTIKTKPLEYAEYDKYLVQQRGVFIAMLVLGGCLALGLLASLFLRAGNGVREIIAFAISLLCTGCIFAAFSQYHALYNSIIIDETTGGRYDR